MPRMASPRSAREIIAPAMDSTERPSFNSSTYDHDYWLSRCKDFQVFSPQGPLGVVQEIRYSSRQDRPDVLVVRSGLFGRRVLVIAVERVQEIIPREQRILLRPEES